MQQRLLLPILTVLLGAAVCVLWFRQQRPEAPGSQIVDIGAHAQRSPSMPTNDSRGEVTQSPISRQELGLDAWSGAARAQRTVQVVVVDADQGIPIIEGTISWVADREGSPASTVEISGRETGLMLPSQKETIWLSASAAGFYSGAPEPFLIDRDGGPIILRLKKRLNHVSLRGEIYVNGIRRVPEGLEINIIGDRSAEVRIERRSAIFEVGQVSSEVRGLWITSMETAPLWRDLAAQHLVGGNVWRIDLETARIVSLALIDGATDLPARAVTVLCTYRMPVQQSTQHISYQSATLEVVSDVDGRATLQALPQTGYYSLLDVNSNKVLLERVLNAQYPLRAEEKVVIHADPALVWGILEAAEQVENMAVRYTPRKGKALNIDAGGPSLSCDHDGHWEFVAEVPSEWWVWGTAGGQQATEVAAVTVSAPGPTGPITLRSTNQELRVRILGSPGQGFYRLSVSCPGQPYVRQRVQATRGEMSIEAHIGGPSLVYLMYQSMEGLQNTWQIEWEALPGDKEKLIDLEAFAPRSFDIRVNGEHPQGSGILSLIAREAEDEAPQYIFATLEDGISRDVLPLPPGLYNFFYISDQAAGCIGGVTNLTDGLVQIAWEGQAKPREALGSGIIISRFGPYEVGALPFTWREGWSERDSLLLPVDCEYEVISGNAVGK